MWLEKLSGRDKEEGLNVSGGQLVLILTGVIGRKATFLISNPEDGGSFELASSSTRPIPGGSENGELREN